MKPVVYILKSNYEKYYVGSTDNIERRIEQHKKGYTHSTKRLGKLELVFSQEFPDLKTARIVEYKLKKLKRKDYIEKIVKEGYIKTTVK